MGDVVNLRGFRKARRRAEADAQAQENRVVFGRRKDERVLAEREQDLAQRRLDGHRRNEDS